jgi:hypothetical protein
MAAQRRHRGRTMEYLFMKMWMWELAALGVGLVTGWLSCSGGDAKK